MTIMVINLHSFYLFILKYTCIKYIYIGIPCLRIADFMLYVAAIERNRFSQNCTMYFAVDGSILYGRIKHIFLCNCVNVFSNRKR